jgi:hypothetical protein
MERRRRPKDRGPALVVEKEEKTIIESGGSERRDRWTIVKRRSPPDRVGIDRDRPCLPAAAHRLDSKPRTSRQRRVDLDAAMP